MESPTEEGQPTRDRGVSFLIDTDIASAYLKGHPRVMAKVMMLYGSLHVSAVTVGELMVWAGRARAPALRRQGVLDPLEGCSVLDIDRAVAERFGEICAALLDVGRPVGE